MRLRRLHSPLWQLATSWVLHISPYNVDSTFSSIGLWFLIVVRVTSRPLPNWLGLVEYNGLQIVEIQQPWQSSRRASFSCIRPLVVDIFTLPHATFSHVQSLHRSHSTNACVRGLKGPEGSRWVASPSRSFIDASCFTLRLTVQWTVAQVLSHLPLLWFCRPLLRTRTCCPGIHVSTVKMHGRMVLLRNSTLHRLWAQKDRAQQDSAQPTRYWGTWCQTVVLQPIIGTFSLRFGREHCDTARLRNERKMKDKCELITLNEKVDDQYVSESWSIR